MDICIKHGVSRSHYAHLTPSTSGGAGERGDVITSQTANGSSSHTSGYFLGHFQLFSCLQNRVFLRRPVDISSCSSSNQYKLFFRRSPTISICDHGVQEGYSKLNHGVFLTLTKWFTHIADNSGVTREKFNQNKHKIATLRNVQL